MNEEWWESPTCWLCNYWWVVLAAIVLALSGYFARDYWRPALGLEPAAAPTQVIGTGDVQVTLKWANANDLDLWVTDPAGEKIFFSHKHSISNGMLDVDANAGCQKTTTQPVENIFWPVGQAPQGSYQVEVNYYAVCTNAPATDYSVRIQVDGKVQEFEGTIGAKGDLNRIATIQR